MTDRRHDLYVADGLTVDQLAQRLRHAGLPLTPRESSFHGGDYWDHDGPQAAGLTVERNAVDASGVPEEPDLPADVTVVHVRDAAASLVSLLGDVTGLVLVRSRTWDAEHGWRVSGA
jgi:hypothetical protein